jgi:hypothetical protein
MLAEMGPVNKALQRLLAGLIPVRARAVNYSVVTVGEKIYVVHNGDLGTLGIDSQPLDIVGVTELQSYWKDIRRVLFSKSHFTILCRVGRDGLHTSWTPVKLADLFVEFVPGLSEQLAAVEIHGRPGTQPGLVSPNGAQQRLAVSLATYTNNALTKYGTCQDAQDFINALKYVASINTSNTTASGQREAFRLIDEYLRTTYGIAIPPDEASALRDSARQQSDVELFPGSTTPVTVQPPATESQRPDPGLLMDVEIIAIYW